MLTRKRFVALLAASPALFLGQAKAAPSGTNEATLETETLPDGTRLVVLSDPNAKQIAIDVFFRVGLADEGGLPGIRSLIARSWIGEAEFRSTPLLFSDIRRFGGGIGTGCAEDWVDIWSVGPSDEETVRTQMQTLLTNLVSRPVFGQASVARARAEQERALVLAKDDLWTQVTDTLRSRVWETSPLSESVLGDAQTVAKMKPEKVTDFYETYFRPNRCVVSIAGNITWEGARHLVVNSISAGARRNAKPAPPEKPFVKDTIPLDLRTRLVSRHAPATLVAVGLLAPGTETGRNDYLPLLLMDTILGGGKASRLFALRENEGIAYDLRTRLFANRAQSLWVAYVIGDAPPDETLPLVNKVLDAWAKEDKPATEAELARAKALLLTRHLSDRQRLRDRAWALGWAETMGLGAEWETQFAARLEAVALDEVNRIARRVLGGSRAMVQSLGPLDD